MWRIVVPPDAWRSAFEVSDDTVTAVKQIAANIGLVINVDEVEQKVYLGPPGWHTEPSAIGSLGKRVDFPSGISLDVVDWTLMGSKYRPATLGRAASLVGWKNSQNRQVSEHFTLGEFICHDQSYGYLRLDPALLVLLETIRKETGPLSITSGYRPPAYQALVNPAVTNSEHMNGTAADITCSAIGYDRFWAICERLNPNGGVGRYPTQKFVHTDTRPGRSRWG